MIKDALGILLKGQVLLIYLLLWLARLLSSLELGLQPVLNNELESIL